MILIERDVNPPERLKAGLMHTRAHCKAYLQDSAAYRNGAVKFEFKKAIYGHGTVKRALMKMQHDKCCFCEGKFKAFTAGDVEHFRPKQCVQQTLGSKLTCPGYYWLAYAWTNLLFSCPVCNRSGKRSYFPLADPRQRARNHTCDVNDESPLLIDPSKEDPRAHIKFLREVPTGITEKGRVTIAVLQLDRLALNDLRLERLRELESLDQIVKLSATIPGLEQCATNAAAKLVAAPRKDAVFSSMATDLLFKA